MRLELNKLQVEGAHLAGIHPTRLSQLENGHIAPRGDELERLAEALGVPLALLHAGAPA